MLPSFCVNLVSIHSFCRRCVKLMIPPKPKRDNAKMASNSNVTQQPPFVAFNLQQIYVKSSFSVRWNILITLGLLKLIKVLESYQRKISTFLFLLSKMICHFCSSLSLHVFMLFIQSLFKSILSSNLFVITFNYFAEL